MAKGNPSILEHHVEKAVLGLCVLFLLYALVHWGLGSPMDPASMIPAPPSMGQVPTNIEKIDEWLAKQAQVQKTRVANTPVKPNPVPPWLTLLEQQIKAPPVAIAVDMGVPRQPTSMPGGPKERQRIALKDLIDVIPAAEAIKVETHRVLPRRENQEADVGAAFGVSVYPYHDLAGRWGEQLKNSTVTPMIAFQELRVERQEQLVGGAWSDPVLIKLDVIPLVDGNNPVEVPVVPKYDGTNTDAIRAAMDNLRNVRWQQQVIQPLYPDVFYPNRQTWADWRIYLPNNEVSSTGGDPVSAERSGALVPAVAPTAPPTPTPTRPVGPGPRDLPGGPGMGRDIPVGPGGMGPGGPGGPGGMGPGGPGGPGGMGPGPGPGPGPRVTPVVTPTPSPTPGARPTPTPSAPVGAVMANTPELPKQIEQGKTLAWFEDMTLEDGKTYRYRVSVRLVNPLLGAKDDVKDEADAKVAAVDSPWSPWSQAVSVVRSADFFVTGANPTNKQVKLTVFSTEMGQVVGSTMSAAAGQPIGGKEKKKVVNPLKSETVEKEVNFGTGSVVVSVNFSKRIYRNGIPKDTVEVLYLDVRGELKSRLMDVDMDSKPYKDLVALSQMK